MEFSAMKAKVAVDITEIDYKPYGILFNLSGEGLQTNNTNTSQGQGWTDVDTAIPVLDSVARLGYTFSEKQPFVVVEMEKHSHTQEAQLPTDQPIIFCMAKAGEHAPLAEDIIPVILRPGYVFVFHRETWHSASHGLNHNGSYHWMAQVYENEPTVWQNIADGPVYISAENDSKTSFCTP